MNTRQYICKNYVFSTQKIFKKKEKWEEKGKTVLKNSILGTQEDILKRKEEKKRNKQRKDIQAKNIYMKNKSSFLVIIKVYN